MDDKSQRRPDYCPDDLSESEACPLCGATVEGNDPMRGVCQARFSGTRPRPYIQLVLIDRRTGEIV